ncbi:MAG: 3-carboxy-cis,cis-muconate cycloisomerase [Solirubrobacteraceae bacterium]
MFDAIVARGAAAAAVTDEAWLQAMLDAEAALARALARAGLIEEGEAEAIAAACHADRFDAAAIAAAAAGSGNPVVPLKAALTGAVDGPAARHVHRGATSQDILDSAAMLVTARALAPLLEDVGGAASAAADLARAHRDTPMAGRTLLQQAVPVTFGLKAAGWLAGLDDARRWLEEIRLERLAAQLGGAAGTLASLGDAGPQVASAYAELLGLAEPVLPWHTQRGRIGELASALAVLSGAVAKTARDIVLLSQTEVAEVREGARSGDERAARGGSSTMPHKRNPVAAICALGCAQQTPGLAATLLGAMAHEHERAAGSWHAEWRPLGELLRSTGSAVAWLRESLEGLEVDPERMRANLELTGGRVMAERVAAALERGGDERAARGSGPDAHQRMADAARGEDFRAAVGDLLGAEAVEVLLDPVGYLGSAGTFVDRALDDHDREG